MMSAFNARPKNTWQSTGNPGGHVLAVSMMSKIAAGSEFLLRRDNLLVMRRVSDTTRLFIVGQRTKLRFFGLSADSPCKKLIREDTECYLPSTENHTTWMWNRIRHCCG